MTDMTDPAAAADGTDQAVDGAGGGAEPGRAADGTERAGDAAGGRAGEARAADGAARVGDRLGGLRKRMTQEIIDAWAGVSGDHNPLHTDPEFAAGTRFGGTIAHGHLALAWLCELMLRCAGTAWLAGGELRNVRFTAPVRPGETYEVTGSVTGVDARHVTVAVEVTGPAGVCATGEAVAPVAVQNV